MRLLSLLCLLALAAPAVAATLYRWVDRDGVVHYSDRPQPGAEVIELRGAQGYEPPQYGSPSTPTGDEEQTAGVSYSAVDVVQPSEDEVLWNIEGQMDVLVRVIPQLRAEHGVQIYYDGQAVGEPSRGGGSFQIDNVWRGTHTLQAAVVDEEGRELARSEPRTFHVRQTSVLNPQNPQRPRRPTR